MEVFKKLMFVISLGCYSPSAELFDGLKGTDKCNFVGMSGVCPFLWQGQYAWATLSQVMIDEMLSERNTEIMFICVFLEEEHAI